MPRPTVLAGRTSSAVCSSSSRVSSADSVTPCSRAAAITSAAAPAALPVFVEPVGPCIEMDDLPPNCVVFAPRKYVDTGTWVPSPAARAMAMIASRMPGSPSWLGSSWPSPSASATTPCTSWVWS